MHGGPSIIKDTYLCLSVFPLGTWGLWGAWSACSMSCGGGQRIRTRQCLGGSGVCTGGLSQETVVCNEQQCQGKY